MHGTCGEAATLLQIIVIFSLFFPMSFKANISKGFHFGSSYQSWLFWFVCFLVFWLFDHTQWYSGFTAG